MTDKFQASPDVLTENNVTYEQMRSETQSVREDFLVVFGIFASLFIFLSIEVQIFKEATRFSLLVGFSLFLLGSILAFIMCLHSIVKENNTWAHYKKNPVTWFVVACFLAAVVCFAWASFVVHN